MFVSGGKGRVVLWVDDDPVVRISYARMLRRHAHVLEAESHEEALRKVSETAPTHAFLDIDLGPGPSGIVLRNDLRRRWQELPVTFVTGLDIFGKAATNIDGDRVLYKPVVEADLVRELESPRRKWIPAPRAPDDMLRRTRYGRVITPIEGTAVILGSLPITKTRIADAVAKDRGTVRTQQENGLSKLELTSDEAAELIGKPTARWLAHAIHRLFDTNPNFKRSR